MLRQQAIAAIEKARQEERDRARAEAGIQGDGTGTIGPASLSKPWASRVSAGITTHVRAATISTLSRRFCSHFSDDASYEAVVKMLTDA